MGPRARISGEARDRATCNACSATRNAVIGLPKTLYLVMPPFSVGVVTTRSGGYRCNGTRYHQHVETDETTKHEGLLMNKY